LSGLDKVHVADGLQERLKKRHNYIFHNISMYTT